MSNTKTPGLQLGTSGQLTVSGVSTSCRPYEIEILSTQRSLAWQQILTRTKFQRFCFGYPKALPSEDELS